MATLLFKPVATNEPRAPKTPVIPPPIASTNVSTNAVLNGPCARREVAAPPMIFKVTLTGSRTSG